ncbi:hypothetical protein MO867_17290 [Microbulbifer sp. OS29]|uniref:Uncharacterized protein n=1 Tax=Microbulbifer okhotskensis TaxID=2926617 RepID=A0A9X2J6B4_9GAMM|nr:hypothetical protein [Microbulbifer okhotskensis]MCO1336088.1 hypothetical protein [Microbulbifer okhotskensis]
MTQLYGHKWTSQHRLYDSEEAERNGVYSEDFMLWARKTRNLSDKDWARGMENIEYRNTEAARNDETSWPPNYAEFLGFCLPAPGSAAHKDFKPLALPDKNAQVRARKSGESELAKMRGMFDL